LLVGDVEFVEADDGAAQGDDDGVGSRSCAEPNLGFLQPQVDGLLGRIETGGDLLAGVAGCGEAEG
jgi:hypothetical protein